jgi:tetratricopeptide (TPR) repeat protein
MSYLLITFTLLFSDYASLRKASMVEFRAGHYAQAEALMRTALESARSNKDDYEEALSYSDLGEDLQAQGRFLDAERAFQKALSIFNQRPEYAHAAAIVLRSLATDLTAQLQYRQARVALKEATKLISKNKVQDPLLSAAITNSLGVIQFNEGEIDKAANSFSRAAAVRSESVWEMRSNMGHVYQIRRQYDKAEEAYSESLRIATGLLGSNHPNLSICHDNLGLLYMEMGRFNVAEKQFRQSLALLESSDMSSNTMPVVHALYHLAMSYVAQKNEAQARPFLARAATMARKHENEGDRQEVAEILEVYAKVLKDLSSVSEAEHVQTEARRVRAGMAFTVPLANLH